MRKTTTAVLAAVAAVPLAFLAAAPASAAPGDVTAVFTTAPNGDGTNTVTGTFTVQDNALTICTMGSIEGNDGINTFYASNRTNSPSVSLTVVDNDVLDGIYTVQWVCFDALNRLVDGTAPLIGPSYGEPTTLVVPAVVPEEPEAEAPGPDCTGSACLSTGSFGF